MVVPGFDFAKESSQPQRRYHAKRFSWLILYGKGVKYMAKVYAQVAGVVLLILGVIGFFVSSLLGAPTAAFHNLIHLVSGAWGAYAGFRGGLGGPKTFAQIFGVVYTIVGVVGFLSSGILNSLGIPVSGVYNLIHLVIGLWGLYAGFSKQAAMA